MRPGQKSKPLNLTWETDALIGDGEKIGKQNKNSNEAILNHMVDSYDPHGPYDEPILFPVHKE